MTTIVLLSYLSGWCENDTISFTGELTTSDSVVSISIDDLRVANAKMIELKYEKEINASLKEIISNDSITINALKQKVDYNQAQSNKYKKQRNIAGGTSVGLLILLILSIL